MFKHTVKYTDFNGESREKDVYFYVSVPEMMSKQHSVPGGYGEYLSTIAKEQDVMKIWQAFDDIIEAAYGEKTPDGERFIKVADDGTRLFDKFKETPAYEALMVELLSNSDLAAEMVNKMMPEAQLKKLGLEPDTAIEA